jgi:hypothetical protein
MVKSGWKYAQGGLANILPDLPDELGRKVSFLYAEEKTSRALFQNNAKYFRQLALPGTDHRQQLFPLFDRGSAEISRLVQRVFECVEAVTTCLEPASAKGAQHERG